MALSKTNNGLKSLSIDGNSLSESFGRLLAGCIDHSPSSLQINMSNCGLTDDQFHDLISSLAFKNLDSKRIDIDLSANLLSISGIDRGIRDFFSKRKREADELARPFHIWMDLSGNFEFDFKSKLSQNWSLDYANVLFTHSNGSDPYSLRLQLEQKVLQKDLAERHSLKGLTFLSTSSENAIS